MEDIEISIVYGYNDIYDLRAKVNYEKAFYAGSEPIGLSMEYYTYGGMISKTWFRKRDNAEKLWEWYKNGTNDKIATFKDGKSHGKEINWYKDEGLYNIIPFKNGEYDGTYLEWNPQGKFIRKTSYYNGELHGIDYIYYSDNTIREMIFENGKFVQERTYPQP